MKPILGQRVRRTAPHPKITVGMEGTMPVRLTPKQLRTLREGAEEDLLVACDRALGLDSLDEVDGDERLGIVETSHRMCVVAWSRRRGR